MQAGPRARLFCASPKPITKPFATCPEPVASAQKIMPPAKTCIFVQESRLGRRVFEIDHNQLKIDFQTLGKKRHFSFLIADINPQYEVRNLRLYAGILYFGTLSALLGWATIALLNQTTFPRHVAISTGGGALVMLWFAARYLPTSEVLRFYNHEKKLLFDIVRTKKQGSECDEFVAELVSQIISPGTITRPQSTDTGTQQLPTKTGPQNWRWKYALGLGASSAVLPLVPAILPMLGFFALPILMLCSAGGIGFCYWSFTTKEPHRYLAVIGGMLAILPAYLY